MVNCKINIGDHERTILEEISLMTIRGTKRVRTNRIVFVVIGIIFLFFGALMANAGGAIPAVILLAAGVFIILLATILQGKLQRNALRRGMAKDPDAFSGDREYVFDESGVRITSNQGSSLTAWDGFKSWGYYNDYICLLTKDSRAVLVDKSKLKDEEMAEIQEYLKDIPQKDIVK